MATINVKDAGGSTVAVEKPLTPGRAAAASSRPIVLSTEDKSALDALATSAKQDTGNSSLSSILSKLTSDPSTATKQDAIISAIEGISPGGGSGGDASASNQSLQLAQETAINTVLGVKTDDKSTSTDTTSVSAMSVWKQISSSVQAIASSIAGTLTVGLPTGAATSANQTSQITQETAINTVLGTKTDNKSTATDATSTSAMSIWKQISASIQVLAGAVSSSKVAIKAASGDFADGSVVTLGAKTDAKSTATDGTSVSGMQVLKQISASVQGATPAGTNHMGKVQIGDGTNNAVVKAASTSSVVTDPALVVSIRPDSLKDTFGEYETIAASQTDQALGATGATGDYLSGVLIVPGTAAAGAVSIKDGSGSSITIFAGGGTTALPTLAPIFVPLGIYSTSGAWKVTTGSNVTAIGIGDFT